MSYAYRSKFEETIGKFLEDNEIDFEYETIELPYRRRIQSGICSKCGCRDVFQNKTYTPDFVFPSHGILIEAKGHLSPNDRGKMRAVKDAHPEKDIRLVFMSNNKISKTNNARYSDWAEKFGFPYSVKTIPLDWFEEADDGE